MSVHISWQDESQGILRYDFGATWTWDELEAAFDQGITMGKDHGSRVDVIVNLLDTDYLPVGALNHVKTIADRQVPNAGLSIIVTRYHFIHMLYDIGQRVYRPIARYFRVVPTLDDALALIDQERAAV